jgi:hypothetical protein
MPPAVVRVAVLAAVDPEGRQAGARGRVKGADGRASFQVPEGYLPRLFKVVDACVTNASGVWLWKHFYL